MYVVKLTHGVQIMSGNFLLPSASWNLNSVNMLLIKIFVDVILKLMVAECLHTSIAPGLRTWL